MGTQAEKQTPRLRASNRNEIIRPVAGNTTPVRPIGQIQTLLQVYSSLKEAGQEILRLPAEGVTVSVRVARSIRRARVGQTAPGRARSRSGCHGSGTRTDDLPGIQAEPRSRCRRWPFPRPFRAGFVHLSPGFVQYEINKEIPPPVYAGQVRHKRREGVRHTHCRQGLAQIERTLHCKLGQNERPYFVASVARAHSKEPPERVAAPVPSIHRSVTATV